MSVQEISRRVLLQAGLTVLGSGQLARALPDLLQPDTYTVPVAWNNALLQAIRNAKPAVPVGARALAIVHTSMFDAWAAYDRYATGTYYGNILRRPWSEQTQANKEEAISYAAYRTLMTLFSSQADIFNALLKDLGYTRKTTTDALTPSGIGNLAAQGVLSTRFHDGANQLGDIHKGAYSDYSGYKTPNTPDQINDPNLWQPLRIPTKDGKFVVQTCVTPHWNCVRPFALKSSAQFRPTEGPATINTERYYQQANQLLDISAALTDTQKTIAEYWEDGPGTAQPPGHWCLNAQYVMRRDAYSIDNAVKLFFILANTLFDASIACWDTKCFFNSERPITAIRYIYRNSQIQAWGGPSQGTKLIPGASWQPYQRSTVVTPSFPEFTSGHSSFSAASAFILNQFTGTDYFGATYIQKAGASLIETGLTPQQDVKLSWKTFSQAAREAGMSRLYGGIHFAQANQVGQYMGRQVAMQVWQKAMLYINGKRQV